MPKKPKTKAASPERAQGRPIDAMSEEEANAYELYCLTKVLNDWHVFYDGILEKAGNLKDENDRRIIMGQLKDWEDRHIPRLLEIRCDHFKLLEEGHMAAPPVEEGFTQRGFLIRNLSSHQERVALMYELSPVLASLVALDKVLDQALARQEPAGSA
jgi:hypothetical protein